ncbi:DUF2726 domain-containing protein [Ottowia testudinis]|uniref:DUF2726 domain-containing protein n=1 Tax=Ottowia testudinis TaxID=2816950 RepID=A0A975H7C6_9BURK|nr:DUF2726 domain-containing protein [Ottowia testudinis]QTD46907.1 DUF2726 domain-containing protein [Ottowia testudinis]
MGASTGSSGILIVILVVAVGLLAALLGLTIFLLQRRGAKTPGHTTKRRLPAQWPINPRPLVNSGERRVWHWLQATFAQHHVMVKLPVTRFTMPRESDEGEEWFGLLSGVYCTFTVCDDRGQVVGCVDVMGPRGLSRGNRQLKQTLLSQCGIGYWVVSPESPPDPDQLRADFVGTPAPDSMPQQSEQARLEIVRLQLHEALDRKRGDRHHHALECIDQAEHDGEITSWPQADSFLGTLDSRRSGLEKV